MTTDNPKKTSQTDWHPADIIAALHKRGITLSSLATSHGLSSSTSFSATFTRSMPANEKRIADAIGVHPKVIWPSRYNADGSRKLVGFRKLQFNATATARKSKAPSGKKTKKGGAA